jgi:hypothetical protein
LEKGGIMKKKFRGVLAIIICLPVFGVAANTQKEMPADYKGKRSVSIQPVRQCVTQRVENRDVILIDEGFEDAFPPVGWDVVEISGIQGGATPIPWHKNSYSVYVHTGSFSTVYGWGFDLDGWLRILNLNLSGAESVTFSFWWQSSYEWHVYPYDNGDLFVEVSTDGGTTWDTLWTFGDPAMVVNSGVPWPWEDWVWYESTLNLDAYAGQPDVMVGFHVVADDNGDIALDDVLLSYNEPTTTKFERAYGGASDDDAYSVEQTTDGGYIIAGCTKSFGASHTDFYLVKTDVNGDVLWTRTYGGSVIDNCLGARQTFDGGYFLFGNTGWSSSDIYLIKTDANGDTDWTRTYDIAQYDIGYGGEQTSDGGYIITGAAGPSSDKDIYLLKIDANGDLDWLQVYPSTGYDFGWCVEQTSDNGYIVGGYNSSNPDRGYLMKTDPDGNIVWDLSCADAIYSAIQTSDNGYAFTGDDWEVFLAKADADGNIVWTRNYPMGDYWWLSYGYSLQQTSDHGYILAGEIIPHGYLPPSDVLLIRTDANGDTLWTRTYGGPTGDPHDDRAMSVQLTLDNGYVLAGNTETYGAGALDFYLIKTDSLGNPPDIVTVPSGITFDYTSGGFKGLHCLTQTRMASGSTVEPELTEKIKRSTNIELIPVMIIMSEQLNQKFLCSHACELNKSDRRQWVISELKALAQRTQQGLLSYLRTEKGMGKADRIHSLWIANAISAEVTKDIIHKLSSMPEIYQMLYDDDCFHILGKPSETVGGVLSRDIVWGVQKIRADQVWPSGYTGKSIIIGHIDTGVNYNHTDLIDHMWDGGAAYPHHGFDFYNTDNDPIDDNGHGTHTAGTIAGNGTSGTQTGVAPDALIMALKAYDEEGSGPLHDIVSAIQFAIDHDVDIISMSAGFSNPSNVQKDYCRNVCNSAFAADILMVIAAGNGDNAGGHYPVPHDINTPGDVPAPWYGSAGHSAVMAVGMTNSSDVIDSWSSYGPTEWNTNTYTDYPYPPGLIKPDVSAPGVSVVSLTYDNNSGYTGGWDGTSMACPHLAGTVALMLEKNPLLTCVEIDSIIENFGVVDLGIPGRDNYYGAGRIDAYDAVAAVPTTTAKEGVFDIHNTISVGVALKVSEITWTASWIKDVSPAKSETWKQDFTAIEVFVDTTGMVRGTYWDTLWIYSNDPDDNPYPEPVCLITTIIGIEETEKITRLPVVNALSYTWPNPFRSSTQISYAIANESKVSLVVYNVLGQQIKTLVSENLDPGSYEMTWSGKDSEGRRVPAGVYFVRLITSDECFTEKIILFK